MKVLALPEKFRHLNGCSSHSRRETVTWLVKFSRWKLPTFFGVSVEYCLFIFLSDITDSQA